MMMILKVFGMSCPTSSDDDNMDMDRGIIVEGVGDKRSSRGDLSDLDSTSFDQQSL